MPEPWYQWRGDRLLLAVRVQARASSDALVGPHGDWYKVRITAPPVDGEANAHLIRFLAKRFGVAKGAVSLVSGATGREKRLAIDRPNRIPPELPVLAR